MSKKVVTIICLLVMMLISTTAYADSKDTPSSWAAGKVNEAIDLGLVPERLQSNYTAPITREEFAELLVQSVIVKHNNYSAKSVTGTGVVQPNNPIVETSKTVVPWTINSILQRVSLATNFTDANQDYVEVAYILGSINGISDTKFAPNNLITRQEAATMLMNTIHASSSITYPDKVKKSYSDFNNIADWAKPAVLASGAINLMVGVGNKFDYSGNFTREQSIVTMVRIYRDSSYNELMLRGVVPIYSEYPSLSYIVGKDYVDVSYPQTPKVTTEPSRGSVLDLPTVTTVVPPVIDSLGADMGYKWTKNVKDDKADAFTVPLHGIIAYLYSNLVQGKSDELIAATKDSKPITLDFGYMSMSTYGKQDMMEFKLKPADGYMSLVNGYTYGYPKQDVVSKVVQ